MNEIIKKLEAIGGTSSIKQTGLSVMLNMQNINPEDCASLLKKTHEQVCVLLPDDDED